MQNGRNPREEFLKNAAKIMVQTSSSTASFLGSQLLQSRLRKPLQNSRDRNEDSRFFCNACGSYLIPGMNCSVKDGEGKKIPEAEDQRNSSDVVKYECSLCHRYAVFESIPTTAGAGSGNGKCFPPKADTSPLGPSTAVESVSGPRTTKTSSKKRAKARNEQLGIHALLKKSKQESQKPPSLALMDFLVP